MSTERFTFFWRGPFSQWHLQPFTVANVTFNCAEQYMMYAKALLFGDRVTAQRIMAANHPREQKALGREVQHFAADTWDLFREAIVYQGNYARFTQHVDLCDRLLATAGTTLVEASPQDRIWGIGLAEDDPRAQDRSTWQGLNLLGVALTRVRETIIGERGLRKP